MEEEKNKQQPHFQQITNPYQLPALTLAYIGDCVYELWVRKYLVAQGTVKVNTLHRKAVALVRAERQSLLFRQIEGILEDDEQYTLYRGRNAKSGHQPNCSTVQEYRRATGLEALIGYLHLMGREEKLAQIFGMLFAANGEQSPATALPATVQKQQQEVVEGEK